MSSKSAVLDGKPRVRVAPKSVRSDGEDATFLASGYGLTPDPWQADVLDDWLGRDRFGKWSAGRCGLSVARQNGKNGAIEVRELFGMVALGEKFLHTAHEVKTARKAFKRLKYFFGETANDPAAKFPELNALVLEVRNTNGQEAIVLTNGGSVEFVARSKGSGRGFTVDVLVMDEAQDLNEDELEALLPTISSAPLGNPQRIYTGTPPNPEKGQSGAVFARVRASAETSTRIAWTDFGVEDGPLPDLDSRPLWRSSNPALGSRLSMQVIEDEREDLSDEGFARERLGWWGDPATAGAGVIDISDWARLKNVSAKEPTTALIAVDVSPNRGSASLGIAAGGADGRVLVMSKSKAGTAWIVPALKQLIEKREIVDVVLYPGSQAGALIPDLVAAGIEHTALTRTEMGQACAAFQSAVKESRVEHVGQPELDAAVGNARTRWSGESEHFDRRDRTIDISPLVAVSAAAFRWVKHGTPDYDVLESIF